MILVVADDAVDRIVVEAWGQRYQLTRDGLAPAATRPATIVSERARRAEAVTALIAECALEVAARSGVTVSRMRGPCRSDEIARARMAAMWLASARYGVHEADLGIFFHRHRTTAIHALQTVYLAVRGDVDATRWVALLPDPDVARARGATVTVSPSCTSPENMVEPALDSTAAAKRSGRSRTLTAG